MNRGTPPTAPNARTGEFTPPGVASRARANSAALRSVMLSLAGVDDELEQPQRVRQRMLLRGADPARAQRAGVARRRAEHVAVRAVPPQALAEPLRLGLGVRPACPPLVFSGSRAPGDHEEQHPVL